MGLGFAVIKRVSCSTQLSMDLSMLINVIMLINVKMTTFACILTYKNMINTESESLKERKIFILAFKFLQAIEIPCSVEMSMKNEKKFLITSGQ